MASCGVALIIAMLTTLDNILELPVIEDKIKIYEEENKTLESSMYNITQIYMEYESNTLSEFKIEDVGGLIVTYPELKSNALFEKQLDLYIENINKIKSWKEELTYSKKYRWRLYFGN